MTLTLGFSPCPNDTFIFDALVNKKIDTGGLDFDVRLEDVETLNQWAIQGRLDISKISYGVLPIVTGRYRLLDTGGALGKGVGPLLVSRHPRGMADIDNATIAIPGERTTAHLLFSLAFPLARHKKFMIFSDIEDAVLTGKVDCGVIIHESRFTYRQKGLTKLIDLGEFWESKTNAPIPLGGIVFRRDLSPARDLPAPQDPLSRRDFPSNPPDLAATVNALIRKSLEYAFANYPALPDFVTAHAQEMDETVMRQHIDLYVNEYSLSLGNSGKTAIDTLISTYAAMHPAEPAHPLSIVGTSTV